MYYYTISMQYNKPCSTESTCVLLKTFFIWFHVITTWISLIKKKRIKCVIIYFHVSIYLYPTTVMRVLEKPRTGALSIPVWGRVVVMMPEEGAGLCVCRMTGPATSRSKARVSKRACAAACNLCQMCWSRFVKVWMVVRARPLTCRCRPPTLSLTRRRW